jgi:hypothetical protein
MPILRRMVPLAAAAVLGALGMLPAGSPAMAAVGNPADCYTTQPAAYTTLFLTCTNRPVGQMWHVHVYCMGPWVDNERDGNVVTGNGTSTVVCPHAGRPFVPTFVVD